MLRIRDLGIHVVSQCPTSGGGNPGGPACVPSPKPKEKPKKVFDDDDAAQLRQQLEDQM